MLIVSTILTILVILIHLCIVWLEMFVWTSIGKKVFSAMPSELFEPTKVMAANQGLYNGFLAAGLIWSFLIEHQEWQVNVRLFFLGCILVAGLYGSLTVSKKILLVQSLPAALAILAIALS